MIIALIAVMAVSTALVVLWFLLLFAGTDDDKVNIAYGVLVDNIFKIKELRKKGEANREALSLYSGIPATVMAIFYGSDCSKEIAKLERISERIQEGDLSPVSILTMPGHVIRRKLPSIVYSPFFKNLNTMCLEFYGRKYALHKTNAILASMLSYAIIGMGMSLAVGVLLMAAGLLQVGAAIAVVGTAIIVLLAYSLYDNVRAKIANRHAMIVRQFPNVVSKLALLVCSGMIMDRAWQETAQSRAGELYEEMRVTSDELAQNIAPIDAYSTFIKRCNTKETSKLASAILQNLSKGNAEIGNLLREMAREAWQERRHLAKRDAEKANSKLVIPTMLLFVSVLIMIMVPLAMSMGSAF